MEALSGFFASTYTLDVLLIAFSIQHTSSMHKTLRQVTAVLLLLILSAAPSQAQDISAARAAADGETVTFDGIVTRAQGAFTYVQDASGTDGASGFTIRQTSGNFFDDVADGTITQGTSITVTGAKGYFAGLNQIDGSDLTSYTVNSQGNALPAPQVVTLVDLQGPGGEAYEAELVTVNDVEVVNTTDATFVEGTSYDIEDPTQDLSTNPADPVVLRIPDPADTNVVGEPIPTTSFSFTGIIGQFHGFDFADLPDEGYQLQAINPATALPVELASFDGDFTGSGIALTWKTLTETNNAGFDLQHRAPGEQVFRKAAFVEGAGTTNQVQTYRFLLPTTAEGTHTFRLRQIDVDGAETFSAPIEVLVGRSPVVLAGPNPVKAGVSLDLAVRSERTQSVDIALYNVLGQKVASIYNGSISSTDALRTQVKTTGLSNGVYFVRVLGESFQTTRKLTVVR